LKGLLADKIPKEQERIKNFRKQHGATKVGEVTVDMVSKLQSNALLNKATSAVCRVTIM